jgi:alpha-L-fucosidase 2
MSDQYGLSISKQHKSEEIIRMSDQTLFRYAHPANGWDEALPIGNGRLGGMVFGTVAQERVQLNEDSIWYGGPIRRNNTNGRDNLQEIRRLLECGDQVQAEYLTRMSLATSPRYYHPYQPLGDLFVHFFDHPSVVEDYERTLDVDQAIVTVSYRIGSAVYRREYFASAADQTILIRLTCDQPALLTLQAYLMRRPFDLGSAEVGNGTVLMQGECGRDGVRFSAGLQVVAKGGQVRTVGDMVCVEQADSVTLLVAAQTTYRHPQPEQLCLQQLAAAASVDYEHLKERHQCEYAEKYGRVQLELQVGSEQSEAAKLPIPERLARVRAGNRDDKLLADLFHYGRYLLISCSRPGTIAANLQGIWNDSFTPPWESKFTININTQMNYWLAEVGNLAECHTPLFDLIERMLPNGQITARELYGCNGFVAHHNTNIWGDTNVEGALMSSPYWPMGGAWLSLHLWEHFLYSRDETFLIGRAYPIISQSARFLLEYMTLNGRGQLVTGPSLSPENSFINAGGVQGVICMGPSMDLQIAKSVFNACIAAAEILGIDEAFCLELRQACSLVPDPQIGRDGRIMEWLEEYDEAEPGHRHFSHLFGLYPGELIDRDWTPELATAALKSIEHRVSHGSGDKNWSRAWLVLFYARLGDGDSAAEHLHAFLRDSVQCNLLSTYPPYQIDGSFGVAAGVAEMLIQSHLNELRLLPALPADWASGEVHGLRARGGYTVSISWREGRLLRAELHASRSGICRIRSTYPIQVSCEGELIRVETEYDLQVFPVRDQRLYVIVPTNDSK